MLRCMLAMMSSSSAKYSKVVVTERTYACTDGVKLSTRRFESESDDNHRRTRKILCLHGWLDNSASFNRLAPCLLENLSLGSSSSDDTIKENVDIIPTEIVALDFPGHGLSSHKSVDGPPQLLAEYAYYAAELIEALQWGDNGSTATMEDGKTVHDNDTQQSETTINDNSKESNKIILVGHSMGSGVAIVLCAAFPEWFSGLVLLEGGLVARSANDASRHVRSACQRRLRSNRTLFPNVNDETSTSSSNTRAKVYSNLEAAIKARLSTTERMPGDQTLSYEAARDMVVRATLPANKNENDNEAVVFRHDPRLQWPSLQYYTREQVEAFMRDVRTSTVPTCFLSAADGWPTDAWIESVVKDELQPVHLKQLSGSHHFHADPDTVGAVAREVVAFINELHL